MILKYRVEQLMYGLVKSIGNFANPLVKLRDIRSLHVFQEINAFFR